MVDRLATFVWSFADISNASDSSALAQCQDVGIQLYGTSDAAGPFTFWSMPIAGIPQRVSFTNTTFFQTTINYAAGTQVYFMVLDASGDTAGSSMLYSLTSSSDSTCLKPAGSVDATNRPRLTVNTTSVKSCGDVGLGFSGGTAPYQLLASTVFDPYLLNVSTGTTDRGYIWINGRQLGSQTTFALYDSTGEFAPLSQLVLSQGSNSSACASVSTLQEAAIPGADTDIPSVPNPNPNPTSTAPPIRRHLSAGAIAGIVIGILICLAFAVVGIFMLWRRRIRKRSRQTMSSEISMFKDEDGVMATRDLSAASAASPTNPSSQDWNVRSYSEQGSFAHRLPFQTTYSVEAAYTTLPQSEQSLQSIPYNASPALNTLLWGGGSEGVGYSPPALTSADLYAVAQSDTTHQRSLYRVTNADENASLSSPVIRTSSPPSAGGRRPLPPNPPGHQSPSEEVGSEISHGVPKRGTSSPESPSEIFHQHTDAGPANVQVQQRTEIPPPYPRADPQEGE